MIIFLRNIPFETKKYEIVRFIQRVFYDCFLDKPSTNISLDDIEILSILDVNSYTLETHGLARIFPNEVGKRVIKRLDGKFFKGKCLEIREYVNRSLDNDPRNKSPSGATTNIKERRTSDRRRERLINSWQNDPVLVHG